MARQERREHRSAEDRQHVDRPEEHVASVDVAQTHERERREERPGVEADAAAIEDGEDAIATGRKTRARPE